MKQTVRLLLLLLLALSLVSVAFAQESIGVGDSVDGEADGDTVEYEIELEEGQVIVIDLESDDFDTLVRVLDEDGDELASDDDGGDGFNSRLEFEAEDSATYTIVVDAFNEPDGDFELTVEGAEMDEDEDEENEDSAPSGDADIVYDEEVEFDADGEDELEVTFEGSEDDVVTILARAESEQNITLVLLDPDGDEVAIQDSFNFGATGLIRIELPDDGLYTIVIEERDGEELEDEIEVEVLETEALDLNDGPQTSAELDENRDRDVMFFEAEEDVIYFVTVELAGDVDSTLDVELCEGDLEDCFFGDVRMSVSGTELAGFVYEASDDGRVHVLLEYFTFGGEIEVTVTVEEQ
ncbi:MAG: hypothetical protein AAF846_22080 [Chloroflexota bacterium]